jgi:Helix-turn-helix domain
LFGHITHESLNESLKRCGPISSERIHSKALKAARKAAGFPTAAAAAAHFGWSVARYRSHESGIRSFGAEDLKRYAKAFGVKKDQLTFPDQRVISAQLLRTRKRADDQRREVAMRLRVARILRGYQSAICASLDLGIVTPTYLKH